MRQVTVSRIPLFRNFWDRRKILAFYFCFDAGHYNNILMDFGILKCESSDFDSNIFSRHLLSMTHDP